MTDSAADPIQIEIRSTMAELHDAIHRATDDQLAQPSSLPGWTRAHVVGHVAGFSHGMARQWEYGLLGELIELYTGGVAGRNAEIDALVALAPADLRRAADAALDRLGVAMESVTDWAMPISYRDGRALDGLKAAWREYAIHVVDLDLGITSDGWSEALCGHLFGFLASRVPADAVLVLDSGVRVGTGTAEILVHGSHQDVAAWLAGRRPVTALEFAPAGTPELGPWPARKN